MPVVLEGTRVNRFSCDFNLHARFLQRDGPTDYQVMSTRFRVISKTFDPSMRPFKKTTMELNLNRIRTLRKFTIHFEISTYE